MFEHCFSASILKDDLLIVNFCPELEETAMITTGEYICVIDRSGQYTLFEHCFSAGILKDDLLMLNFCPELEETAMATTGEYIFVIDRSGIVLQLRSFSNKYRILSVG